MTGVINHTITKGGTYISLICTRSVFATSVIWIQSPDIHWLKCVLTLGFSFHIISARECIHDLFNLTQIIRKTPAIFRFRTRKNTWSGNIKQAQQSECDFLDMHISLHEQTTAWQKPSHHWFSCLFLRMSSTGRSCTPNMFFILLVELYHPLLETLKRQSSFSSSSANQFLMRLDFKHDSN